MKAASFLLLGAVFAAPTYAQCAGGPDILEENDDCASAVPVPGNTFVPGLNVEATDLDFYALSVPNGEVLQVDLTFIAANGDIDGYLWAPVVGCDSRIQGEGTANGSLAQGFSATDNETLIFSNTSGITQTVILEVRIFSTDLSPCNDYDLTIATGVPAACTLPADSLEDNDDCANAVAIPGNSATGLSVEAADLDFYTVTVPDGEALLMNATFATADGDIDVYLWDPLVACDSRVAGEGGGNGELAVGGSGTDNEFFSYVNTTGASQDLIVEVRIWSGDTVNLCNAYDIDFSFETPAVVAPVTPDCVESFLTFDNGLGGLGAAVYFDLTVTQDVNLTEAVLLYNLLFYGVPVDCEVWTAPMTSFGNETNPAAWTLQTTSDGTSVSAANGGPTPITFATPVSLTTGTHGIAIVYLGGPPLYTNGDGTNQVHTSGDGIMTITGGGATALAFNGPIFTPRIFSGRLCRDGITTIGSPFCAANNNTTMLPGLCTATGSTAVADNDVTLRVAQIPAGQFGIFVVAAAAGATTPVNQGILCLSGPTGRYSMGGQIWQADMGGEASLAIDLTMIPTPMALVPTNPGDTWFFQAWHRDTPPMPGAPGSNFTTGTEITFN